jgi:hypothetical protein
MKTLEHITSSPQFLFVCLLPSVAAAAAAASAIAGGLLKRIGSGDADMMTRTVRSSPSLPCFVYPTNFSVVLLVLVVVLWHWRLYSNKQTSSLSSSS